MANARSLSFLVAPLALLSACPPTTPGTLEPQVTALTGLFSTDSGCLDDQDCNLDDTCNLDTCGCNDAFVFVFSAFNVRNTGDAKVTISDVRIEANADHPDSLANFTQPEFDLNELYKDEQTNVQFSYTTPNGEAQFATLIVESDASNPSIATPIETTPYVRTVPLDCTGTGEGEGEGE